MAPLSTLLKQQIQSLALTMPHYVLGNDYVNLSVALTDFAQSLLSAGGGGIDWQESVKDKDLVASPAIPVLGDRYLIAGIGGAWAAFTINDIVQFDGTTWLNWHPTEGFMVEVEDENLLYYYDGTSWAVYTPLMPFYDVTNYGLVADGATDNSAAFSALLALIPTRKPCIVYFPSSVGVNDYIFASTITANLEYKNITFVGDHSIISGSSFIQFTDASGNGWNFDGGHGGSMGGWLSFKNIYFYSNPAVAPVDGKMLRLYLAQGVTFTDVYFDGNSKATYGLYLDTCSNISCRDVRGASFIGTGADIYGLGVTGLYVDSCVVGSALYGLCLRNCFGVYVRDFAAVDILVAGAGIYGYGSTGVTIDSYYSQNTAHSKDIWFEMSGRLAIQNCVFAHNDYAIYLSQQTSYVTIENVQVSARANGNGIYISSGGGKSGQCNYRINNVYFYGTTIADINLVGNPQGVSITNYQSDKAGYAGILGLSSHTIIGDEYDTPTQLPFVKGITNRGADIISGVAGVKAIGRLTVGAGGTLITDSFVVGATTHTFVAGVIPTAPNTLHASTTPATAAARIALYFNRLSDERVNVEALHTPPDTFVDFKYRTPGVAGNAIAFTELCANCSMDGGNFLGGTQFGVDAIDTFTVDDATGNIHSHGDATVVGDVTAATVNPSNLPVYDVTNYGLVADYAGGAATTNNSIPFAALLAAIPTRTPCIVYFPTSAGVLDYQFPTPVTADLSNKIITFMGSLSGGASYPYFTDVSGTGWIFTGGSLKFKNIGFTGSVNVPGAASIKITSCTDLEMDNFEMQFGLVNMPVSLVSCFDVFIHGRSRFNPGAGVAGTGLYLSSCSRVHIEGLQNSGSIKIDKLSSFITIKDCDLVSSMGEYCVYMNNGSNSIRLDGVRCVKSGAGEGIYVGGSCIGVVIDKPVFIGTTTWDINIQDKPYDVQIRNYISDKAGYAGINNIASATVIGDDYTTPVKLPFVSGITNRSADIVSGIAGVKAIGTLSFVGTSVHAPVPDTLTVAGVVHTYTDDASITWVADTIRAGTSTANSASRTAQYFNYNSSIAGKVFAVVSGNTVIFYAKVPGVAANAYTFSYSNAGVATCDGAGFLGGTLVGVDPIDTFTVDDATGTITPLAATSDLGTNAARYKDLYLQGNIITAGTVDGVDISALPLTANIMKRAAIQLDYTNFSSPVFTYQVPFFVLPAAAAIKDVYARITTGFSAPAVTENFIVDGTVQGVAVVADTTGFAATDYIGIDKTVPSELHGYIKDIADGVWATGSLTALTSGSMTVGAPSAGVLTAKAVRIIGTAGVKDGQTLTISDSVGPVTFTFDSDGSLPANPITIAPGTAASGSLTAIAGAAMTDGDIFTLKDGVNTAVFEFDFGGGGVTPGREPIVYVGTEDAAAMAALIITAINTPAVVTINIAASSGGGALINLINDEVGTLGTQVITETIAGGTLTPGAGMAGGADGSTDAQVKTAVMAAINGTAIGVTATSGGGALINLTNTLINGPAGDIAITEVVGGGSTILTSGMAGGVDGDIFTLSDGVTPITFEFYKAGGIAPVVPRVPITFVAENAAAMAALIIAAINGTAIGVTATSGGAALVNLKNDAVGAAGIVPITQTVAGGTLTPLGMTGGIDAGAGSYGIYIVSTLGGSTAVDLTGYLAAVDIGYIYYDATTITLSVGIAAGSTKYLKAHSATVAHEITAAGDKQAIISDGTTNIESFSATTNIVAEMIASDILLDQLTAGQVIIYIEYVG